MQQLPPFDAARARQIVSHCESPPSENPREPGLRAAFAVYHSSLFATEKEALEFYESSPQRYYEWKPCVSQVKNTEDVDRLLEQTTHDMTVDGDLRVSGLVIAEGFVSRGPPSAPPPPPSPPGEEETKEASGDENTRNGGVAAAATGAAVGAAVGSAVAVPATVAAVQAVGFTTGGIASGSTAAAIMSAEAIASSGAVAAGGTTATLQSIGATASVGALGAGPVAAIVVTGVLASAVVLGGVGYLAHKMATRKPDGQDPESVDSVQFGKWMVVTEEGISNVKFYRFETAALAWRYFNDSIVCRVILNEQGEEQAHGGNNFLALGTIRNSLLPESRVNDVAIGKWMVVTE